MILKPNPVSTERFTWLAPDKLFVAAISDLPNASFGRVYDDACDEGLTLVSERTGAEMVFAVDEDMIRDGEIVGWVLKPAHRQNRHLATVHIFND